MFNLLSVINFAVVFVDLMNVYGQIDRKYEYSTSNNKKPEGSTYVVPFSEPADWVDDKPLKEDAMSEIPLGLLQQISSLANVSEFIENFLDKDTIDPRDNILNYGPGGMERSAGIMPKPSGCIPTDTLVSLQPEGPQEPNIFYYPSCTRVKRCSGCCAHPLVSCQPIETEELIFQVIKSEFSGGAQLNYRHKIVVVVEQHKRCKCDCRKKANDCNIRQVYVERECRCSCLDREEMQKCSNSSDKLWDSDNCLCRCRRSHECTTGTFFDESICACSPVSREDRKKFIIKPTFVNPDKK